MMATRSAVKSASWKVWLMIPTGNKIFPLKCYGKCNRRQSKASGSKGFAVTRRESRSQIQWFLSTYHTIGHFLPGYCCFPDTTLWCFANNCKNLEISGAVVNIFTREMMLALHFNHCTTKDILSAMNNSICPMGSCSSEKRWMLSSHLLLTCLPWHSTLYKFS